VICSAFTAAIGTAIGVHHLWFPLLFSGNYFVHNCLHSPDGSGRTLTNIWLLPAERGPKSLQFPPLCSYTSTLFAQFTTM
ncbi:MAG: hypothetical protein ACRC8B_14975, partial [Aeromonas sobria]|uniref:hypothetical protein n=1 Tax=Aeromonas sobria TaxID=646 RepID=UPI003F2C9045